MNHLCIYPLFFRFFFHIGPYSYNAFTFSSQAVCYTNILEKIVCIKGLLMHPLQDGLQIIISHQYAKMLRSFKSEGDQDVGLGGHWAHPPPPDERIKNTFTCGTTLAENNLETGRKVLLQPRLWRKIHIESGKGRRNNQVRTHVPSRRPMSLAEEEWHITGSGILPRVGGVWVTYREPQSWGSDTRKMSSFSWFENQRDLSESCKKLRL